MFQEPDHLSDEEILLLLDGESARRAARNARAHLAGCGSCRSRMSELQATMEGFASHHRRALEPELPDSRGPAALLRARLAEAAAENSHLHASSLWSPVLARTLAGACAVALIAVLAGMLLSRHPRPVRVATVPPAELRVPDHRLTPGATRQVTLGEVCSSPHEEVVRAVPGSLRQKVFEEYGISNPRPDDYEVDYLIAPGLGGTDDIRNLWPEPSTISQWNAHMKDVLGERLHQLVCHGQLDLGTAQQAIATDWIGAYEKYCNSGIPASTPARRRQRPRQYASRTSSKLSTRA